MRTASRLWLAVSELSGKNMVHSSHPDIEPRIYSPQRIAAIVATLAEDGVPPAQVLARSGLEEAELAVLGTKVSYAQAATVLRNAFAIAPDPTFALRAGERMHVTQYGMWGYALLSSRTYAEVLEFAVKYRRVIGPLAEMTYDHERNPGVCSYDSLLSPDPDDPLYRLGLEFAYAAHLTLSRDIFGASFKLAGLRVAYPMPSHAQAYEEILQCPVQFKQKANEVLLDRAWENSEPLLRDGLTHEMARESCQQFLDDLVHSTGLASKIRRALVERMPWRYPNLEAIATELAMEPRTLRRKLEAQGTTYRQILADVRRRLAIDYLRRTSMTTEEIATRLGYSDASNFRYAFVRWTGRTPHEYRSSR
jgi:AraC-like DNA-binding protein